MFICLVNSLMFEKVVYERLQNSKCYFLYMLHICKISLTWNSNQRPTDFRSDDFPTEQFTRLITYYFVFIYIYNIYITYMIKLK